MERRQFVETPGAFLGLRVCNYYCCIEFVDTNYTASVVPLRNRVIFIHRAPVQHLHEVRNEMSPETTFETSELSFVMIFDFLGMHTKTNALSDASWMR